MTTRSFLAVFPPPPVVARVAAAVDALRRQGDGVGWVRPENIHYTLRFLGDLDAAGLAAAGRAGATAARAIAPFRITLGGTGTFPNGKRPRVLWLGAREGAAELSSLAAALEEALAFEGLGRADKPFAPHLTLGRVRDAGDPAIPARFGAGKFPAESFDVREIVLVKSTLDPRGARYEPLERYALA
jgi:2'-5' RNA ligase